ncbi:MAG: PBSX family phage terminase large subunit [Eubacteriales bacterium]|nr:PBSX family phage terminase large subunit [Eubacteriales bacterium]
MNRKKVGGFRFRPFSRRQLQLLNWWRAGSPHAKDFIVLADGAIRSGKTTAMIASFLHFTQERFASSDGEGADFILAGRSIGVMKRNVVGPMLRMLNAWGWPYEFNRSDYVISIGTNRYWLFGANNEKSQDVVQGMTAAGALLDEAALMPQSFINQVLGRCSVENAKVFLNCNPAGPYHYLKTDFIDKAREMGVYHLHFEMDDNLTLSEETKARYHRTFKGVFYQRFILGRWVQAEGLIYDMFGDASIVDEVDARFLQASERYIVCDYGTTNPCVFLDVRYDGTTALVLREYYFDSKAERYQKTDQQYAEDMDKFIDGNEPRSIVIDPSAASFRTALRKNGHRVREADNDVLDGIRVTASLFVLGRLKIHRQCAKTIEEFRVYVWDEKAARRGVEQPLKVHDHAPDALRYFCRTIVRDRDLR